jgi:hypothetical protein
MEMEVAPTKVFLFGALSNDRKHVLEELAVSLGGEVSQHIVSHEIFPLLRFFAEPKGDASCAGRSRVYCKGSLCICGRYTLDAFVDLYDSRLLGFERKFPGGFNSGESMAGGRKTRMEHRVRSGALCYRAAPIPSHLEIFTAEQVLLWGLCFVGSVLASLVGCYSDAHAHSSGKRSRLDALNAVCARGWRRSICGYTLG